MNKAKLVPGPMLHPHTPVRVRIIYNVKMNVSQVFYACVAQNLGCGWGQVTQVKGDVLLGGPAQAGMKQAEQQLLPKEPDVQAK